MSLPKFETLHDAERDLDPEYILRCVNEREKLVEALKGAERIIRRFSYSTVRLGKTQLQEDVEKIVEALKQAEG